MNASAYLAAQGWRGEGHALHHSGRGITKPILVAQKQNVLGLGKKKHDAHADQCWARAFDDTLKGLNTTENKEGRTEGVSLGKSAEALQVMEKGPGKGALYSNFVRGQSLVGTWKAEDRIRRDSAPEPSEPRNSIVTDFGGDSTSKNEFEAREAKEERRRSRRDKRAMKALRAADKERRSNDIQPRLQEEDLLHSNTAESDTISEARRSERKRRRGSSGDIHWPRSAERNIHFHPKSQEKWHQATPSLC